jgi:hypothetical protein
MAILLVTTTIDTVPIISSANTGVTFGTFWQLGLYPCLRDNGAWAPGTLQTHVDGYATAHYTPWERR